MAGSRLAAFLQVAAFVMPEVAAVERMGRGGGGGGGGWGNGGEGGGKRIASGGAQDRLKGDRAHLWRSFMSQSPSSVSQVLSKCITTLQTGRKSFSSCPYKSLTGVTEGGQSASS